MRLVNRIKKLEKRRQARPRAEVIFVRAGETEPPLEPGERRIVVVKLKNVSWEDV